MPSKFILARWHIRPTLISTRSRCRLPRVTDVSYISIDDTLSYRHCRTRGSARFTSELSLCLARECYAFCSAFAGRRFWLERPLPVALLGLALCDRATRAPLISSAFESPRSNNNKMPLLQRDATGLQYFCWISCHARRSLCEHFMAFHALLLQLSFSTPAIV